MKTAQVPNIDRERYAKAAPFLARLKRYRKEIDFQQWKTLRGQALSGDVEGAEKGLLRILRGGDVCGRVGFKTDRVHKGESGE